MQKNIIDEKLASEVADIYPGLTKEQQQEAEFYLAQYVEVVRGIFERLQAENGAVDKISESHTMIMA